MLRGDHHAIDASGAVLDIFHRNLRFAIRPQKRQVTCLADFGEPAHQFMREHNGQGHELIGFVAGIAEHQALIASAAGIHAHGDIRRLALERRDYGAGVGVETILRARIADFANHPAHDFAVIEDCGGGDFSRDHGQARGHQRFAGDSAHGVLRENGVQDGV